ncbi:MAG: hypothetical protein LBM05_00115, partial [Endomicrobium sp.]|nr:hypothetical protein [Endomicrobium sp.]
MSKIKLKSLSTFLAIIISYMPLYAVGIIQSNDHSFTNNVSVHNFDSFARCPNSIDPETWEKIKNDNTTTFTPEFYQHIYGTPNPSRDLKPFTTWDTICQFCKKEIVPVLALGGLALFGAGVFVYGCLPYYANVGVNAILHGFQQTTAENAANDANAQRERLRLSKRYIYYGPKVWEAIQLKEGGDFVSFDPRIEAHVVIVRESIVDSQSLADASNQPVRNPVT